MAKAKDLEEALTNIETKLGGSEKPHMDLGEHLEYIESLIGGGSGGGNVDDVKVNGTSVVENKTADIKLKTINNETITGAGNIDIQGSCEIDKRLHLNFSYDDGTYMEFVFEPGKEPQSPEELGDLLLSLDNKQILITINTDSGYTSQELATFYFNGFEASDTSGSFDLQTTHGGIAVDFTGTKNINVDWNGMVNFAAGMSSSIKINSDINIRLFYNQTDRCEMSCEHSLETLKDYKDVLDSEAVTKGLVLVSVMYGEGDNVGIYATGIESIEQEDNYATYYIMTSLGTIVWTITQTKPYPWVTRITHTIDWSKFATMFGGSDSHEAVIATVDGDDNSGLFKMLRDIIYNNASECNDKYKNNSVYSYNFPSNVLFSDNDQLVQTLIGFLHEDNDIIKIYYVMNLDTATIIATLDVVGFELPSTRNISYLECNLRIRRTDKQYTDYDVKPAGIWGVIDTSLILYEKEEPQEEGPSTYTHKLILDNSYGIFNASWFEGEE